MAHELRVSQCRSRKSEISMAYPAVVYLLLTASPDRQGGGSLEALPGTPAVMAAASCHLRHRAFKAPLGTSFQLKPKEKRAETLAGGFYGSGLDLGYTHQFYPIPWPLSRSHI